MVEANMTKKPIDPEMVKRQTPSAEARRALLKGAAGAGIVMTSLASRSALASISCDKYSNWMSGGSLSTQQPDSCASGFSPGFWKHRKQVKKFYGDAAWSDVNTLFSVLFYWSGIDKTLLAILEDSSWIRMSPGVLRRISERKICERISDARHRRS